MSTPNYKIIPNKFIYIVLYQFIGEEYKFKIDEFKESWVLIPSNLF